MLNLSPRRLAASLVSFEALLVLFLFAGRYKGDPRFEGIPVDLTALFFVVSVAVGGFVLITSGFYRRGFYVAFAALFFVAWVVISTLWSPGKVYAAEKTLYIATLTYWSLFAAALILAADAERVRRFFTLALVLAGWIAVEAALVYAQAPSGAVIGDVGGGYLGLGRVSGFAALIALVAWLFEDKRSLRGVVLLALFIFLMFVLLIGGGRGPFVAACGGIAVLALLGWRITPRRVAYQRYQPWLLALAALSVVAIVYLAATTDTATLRRLDVLLSDPGYGTTAAERLEKYDASVHFWQQAPILGHGIGSWPVLDGGMDRRSYPHNLFLEVMVELGLVGLAILVALFVVAFRSVSLNRLRTEPLLLLTFILFVNTFLNAMVTGDLSDNRAMFMMLGLMAMRPLAEGIRRDENRGRAPALRPLYLRRPGFPEGTPTPGSLGVAQRTGLGGDRGPRL